MRPEKQLLLDEIKEKIENANGFLIARYRNMKADKARGFRDLVVKSKGEFEIVKKRIFAKALKESKYKFDADKYTGDIGILFAFEDPAAISKLALKFGEENDKAIELVGAVIDGSMLNTEEVVAFATLPGLDDLRAQFLGLLAAPMQQTVSVFESVLSGVPSVLDARVQDLEKVQS